MFIFCLGAPLCLDQALAAMIGQVVVASMANLWQELGEVSEERETGKVIKNKFNEKRGSGRMSAAEPPQMG